MNEESEYGACKSCINYERKKKMTGPCANCIWTVLADGTHFRSGWQAFSTPSVVIETKYNRGGKNV